MANPLKGEVGFTAGDEDFTLVYSVNAIIQLETDTGKPITKIGDFLGADSFSFANARIFFWAGLLEYHNVTLEEAGSIMSRLGIEKALTLAGESLKASLPQEAARGTARPRTAGAGTGKPS